MKVSGSFGLGALSPMVPDRQTAPVTEPPTAKVDSSSISPEARARAEAAAHPRFGVLSVAAHQDSELADQLAYDYGHTLHQPLLDISRWDEEGFIRYSATGEPVTPQSEARFRQMAENFQTASLALYNEETAKGTDSAGIFDKLIELGDRQPAEFRTLTRWDATPAEWD